MSKQYLTIHTVDEAQTTDIYGLAATRSHIFVAGGASSLKIFDTSKPDFPLHQSLEGVHRLGCHDICASRSGNRVASLGFGGECIIWEQDEGADSANWKQRCRVKDKPKAGEIWAIALSSDGRFLGGTSMDGQINVWDLDMPGKDQRPEPGCQMIREFETKGSMGMCIDFSPDGGLTASGHENGGIYVFNNESGRLLHSLPGLVEVVRAVLFSPGGSLLAAAGDSKVITLYDTKSGEQVANLTGHEAWIFAMDWNHTGEYLLTGSFDGKVKVWSVEQRTCVATHYETEKTLWSVKWLPKTRNSEVFATAGANRSVSFYREASGG